MVSNKLQPVIEWGRQNPICYVHGKECSGISQLVNIGKARVVVCGSQCYRKVKGDNQ